jgi:predicted metal-dependent phosphoesterase TrpH
MPGTGGSTYRLAGAGVAPDEGGLIVAAGPLSPPGEMHPAVRMTKQSNRIAQPGNESESRRRAVIFHLMAFMVPALKTLSVQRRRSRIKSILSAANGGKSMTLIDTHVHTSYSDGQETPEEIIALAADNGIGLLSITDHDLQNAYPRAIGLGQQRGINVVPGVEVTTMDEQGCSCVHIVGLGVTPGKHVSDVLDRIVRARNDSNVGFLCNINDFLAKKYPSWQPVYKSKPSVFHNVMQSATACGISITEKELMDIILNPELWTPMDFEITVDEAVAYIKEWGGVPVLAHPFDFSNDAGLVLKRFLAAGGEGVELCKYRYKVRSQALSQLKLDELLAREREMNLWTVAQAKKHGLKLTMASDHHDGRRPLGMDPADYGIDVSWLYEL